MELHTAEERGLASAAPALRGAPERQATPDRDGQRACASMERSTPAHLIRGLATVVGQSSGAMR
ncbi:MAG TPA: hypothetical protein VFH48_20685 [Chloroflexota bacterium]|nr:hypothetical protein [Chloroflexota bacterium]